MGPIKIMNHDFSYKLLDYIDKILYYVSPRNNTIQVSLVKKIKSFF